ncbi:MAG: DNA polymerase III subunit delta [Treponema sp.]|jgi:DNA polymerase-3 subunit delta|nr:DNA polymerase III subunit delta [Treponema sp.]
MAQGKTPDGSRCWIFLGPELGKKQDAIDEIRRGLVGGQEGTSPEETSFYAGETSVSQMVAALRNGSLFAPSRLFLIKNAELIKKKDEVELLASYMVSPQADTALILISDETKLAKGLEDAVSKDKKTIFWELFENQKLEWVTSFFRREGYTVDPDGIETILEMVENNTDALRRECTRLMLFLGKDTHIGAADVEEWLSHTREESSFTLFSRIAAGDLSKSVESLHTLLAAKEMPPRIFGGLAGCFRKLRDYLILAKSGRVNDFEMKKIGIFSPKARADYALAAKRYTASGADSCLALTAEYEILLKSNEPFTSVLMDLYLYKIFGIAV